MHEMEAEGSGRHCALCLAPLAKILRCGECRTRTYCSRECHTQDWKPGGLGQGHKQWCSLGVGEEGVDWEVRHISDEKGLGMVALRTLQEGTRILVALPPPTTYPYCYAGSRDVPCPRAPPVVAGNFIAASIQFEYDPDELATNTTTQLVHASYSKTYA